MSWKYGTKGLVDPVRVAPAFTTLAPKGDESLVGLLSRMFGETVFSNFSKALARASIATNRPDFVAGSDLSEAQIEALARRLGTDVEEISQRLHRPAHGGAHGVRGIDFHGHFLRLTFLARQERRVSPRALLHSPHHRALWDLRPLSFDMDTMETLLDTCPVCGRLLGWRNLFGPTKCDLCVDERGLPSTDLRDFPQPLLDERLWEAAKTCAGLMHPSVDVRMRHHQRFPLPWGEIAPGDLFHLIVEMAGMAASPDQLRLAHAPLTYVSAEALADATAVLLEGPEGLHAWAINFASRNPHWTVDRPVALKGYDRLVQCRYISVQTVDVLKAARRDGQDAHRRKRVGAFDWLVAKDLDAQFGVGMQRARYFVNRLKAHARAGEDLAELGFPTTKAELGALAPIVRDAISLNEAAGILGVGADVAAALGTTDLFPELPASVRPFFRSGRAYSKTTCEALRATFWSRVEYVPDAVDHPSIARSLKDSGLRPLPRAVAWRLIWSGEVPAVRTGPARADWLEAVRVTDPKSFIQLLCLQGPVQPETGRIAGTSEAFVTAAIAAELINTDIAVVGQLVREQILVPTSGKPRLFRRSDVDDFARTFITGAELRKAMGLPPKGQLPESVNQIESAFDFAGQRNRFYRRSECRHLLGR